MDIWYRYMELSKNIELYRMGPPSYKWVYKPWNNPYEYYSYIFHKATEIRQLNATLW